MFCYSKMKSGSGARLVKKGALEIGQTWGGYKTLRPVDDELKYGWRGAREWKRVDQVATGRGIV